MLLSTYFAYLIDVKFRLSLVRKW